ncbi:MAG TPA: TylF/MycF/NovP-related O-methyltransferase [Acetobacteraceae bacterium]|nr:TylF/MycF/NovP-related O-methyltransferase [Acetobacteraceae bacterium]
MSGGHEGAINPDRLPRAIALQYDRGEVVWPAGGPPRIVEYSFNGQGLRAFGKNPGFLEDARFQRAYARGWNSGHQKAAHIDDARWVVHVALWAASQAARLPGDFVECGVDTGMLSLAICEWLDFNALDKDFWLFDTFAGIPESQMTESERNGIGGWHNRNCYRECYGQAAENFSPWPRCRLVRGIVPESLASFPADRTVAYLSIDMNIVAPEIAAIRFFWERLVPGALVLLDDYAWSTHAAQKAAFDAFAASHGTMILTLPTGQGLLIR